ncbi:coatomer subunit beta [Acrasis kona]|uniref:Coatomer subunit beta n=1 Tax=Acrasis kona TaxID=1008807 RepID=A0AAW2Z3P4_9EUKA
MLQFSPRLRAYLILGIVVLLVLNVAYMYRGSLFSKGRQIKARLPVDNSLEMSPEEIEHLIKQLVEGSKEKEAPKPVVVEDKTSSKADLQVCADHLGRCQQFQKVRIVVIDTAETHPQIRMLIGSLHHHHKGQIKAVIYGLNLPKAKVNEVLLWDFVEYIDLEQEFYTAQRVAKEEKAHFDKNLWKPLVIKHSVEVFGKVLFVDDSLLFTSSIIDSEAIKSLEKDGHYFAGEKCHQDVKIQGYVLDSEAYKEVLVPTVDCSRRQCSAKDIKESNQPEKKYPCKPIPAIVKERHPDNDRKEVCYLAMREDFITSASQLPGNSSMKSWSFDKKLRLKHNDNKIHVALGFPSTTKGNANPSVDTIPVFSVLVPSFLRSIKKDDTEYKYSLYLAFDESDSFYNKPENQKAVLSKFKELAKGYPAKLIMVQCVDSNGWVPFLWNVAFQHSIDDGADYFYQLNDDIRIETAGWTKVFVDAMRANKFMSDFGCTGPVDTNNAVLLTQAFVSRTHYDIFGFLYPYVFKNWFSDDWITEIYKHVDSNLRETHPAMNVFNSQAFGTRYEVCDATGRQDLATELGYGKEKIKLWLEENKKK